MTRRTRLLGGIALGVAAQLASIGLLLAAAWLIVRAAQHPPVLYLMVAIVAVRFFGISRSVFRYAERLVTHDVAFADGIDQRIAVYRDLDRVAPRGLDRARRGDLVSRVTSDVVALQDRLLRVRIPWIVGVCATFAVVVVIAWLDVRAGLALAVCATLLGVVVRRVVSPWSARRRPDGAQARGDLAAEVVGVALGASELVALDAAGPARARAHAATRDLARDQDRAGVAAGLGTALVLVVIGLGVVAMAHLTASVAPVLVGVLVLAPMALAEPWDGWVEAERFRPDVEQAEARLAALAAAPNPVADPREPHDLPADHTLRAEGVVAGWDTPLFAPVDLTVAPGQVVGISAPSGTGKSTLAHALLRFLTPRAGRISLGGVDVADLRAEDLRRIVGYVGQDEVVFDTSLRENLRIADPDASPEALTEAIGAVGLDSLVRSLPDGLDTVAGPDGSSLSGGERQRLCLARLLLSGHRIWIVDEPSEHLDEPTAEALLDDLVALTHQDGEPARGVILISHSASVLRRCDRVVTLTPAASR